MHSAHDSATCSYRKTTHSRAHHRDRVAPYLHSRSNASASATESHSYSKSRVPAREGDDKRKSNDIDDDDDGDVERNEDTHHRRQSHNIDDDTTERGSNPPRGERTAHFSHANANGSTSDTTGAAVTRRGRDLPRETDTVRLSQRQKQIDMGKQTVGYERYLETVPRSKPHAVVTLVVVCLSYNTCSMCMHA